MLKEIEREQSFKELVVLRTIAMNHIKKERDLAEVTFTLVGMIFIIEIVMLI